MRLIIASLIIIVGAGGCRHTSSARASATCVPAPYGIISWYPAEGNADDVVSRNHGTPSPGVTFGPGKVRQAFEFYGLPNDGVNLSDVPAFDFSGASSFSIEAWVNVASLPVLPNDGAFIVSLNYNCNQPTPATQTLAIQSGGKAFFLVRDAAGNQRGAFSTAPVNTGTWIHLVGVRDVSCQTIYLYVDGVLADTQSDPTLTSGSMGNAIADYIGRRPLCGTTNPFNGKIDEVSIYNRALTACEVAALYDADCAGKCRPGTCTSQGCGC
ncbi:MAG TPA: LamG domain-containing protein [Thermoanaerobaculia bacterium]|nr:LamG domain-containing protein [Thermoanaerobaculia bacterium]